jgi:pentatricopeptide repeat protein
MRELVKNNRPFEALELYKMLKEDDISTPKKAISFVNSLKKLDSFCFRL